MLKRQNKEFLISAIVSAVKIIDRSQDILNDAALDLDKVKRDHIDNQSKLLAVQEELLNRKSEHLEEVKSTVDEKLTSWADVVKKNNEEQQQSSYLSAKNLRQVVKSAIQDSDRIGNVMIFNVKEDIRCGL